MDKKIFKFAKKMCRHAKKIFFKYFDTENNGGHYKVDNTIVTKADTEINEYLIKQVKKHFPDCSVDGEEVDYGKSKKVWICDPVDGTAMYARHIQNAVFSLALVEDGVPTFGCILDPFVDKMYYAFKGEGAFINGKPTRVNEVGWEYMKTIGQVDVWPYMDWDIVPCLKHLWKKSYPISIGSVAHACALVASGALAYCLFPATYEKHVDVAAAKIIVEEAGGIVTDFDGNDQRYDTHINGVIMTNKVLNKDILDIVKKYAKKVDREEKKD